MENIFKLSYSKITDFLSCPKKFQLKHILNLEEEFKETIYTALGSSIHSAIEESLKKDFDYDACLCIFKRELNKHIDNIETKEKQLLFLPTWYNKGEVILTYFYSHYYNKLKGKVLEAEKYFSYPITIKNINILFNGIIDLIYQDEGGIKIIDWKTGKKQTKKDDFQLRIYALVLNKLFNMDVKEFEYVFLKEKTKNKKDVNNKILEQTEKELYDIIEKILNTSDFERNYTSNCRYCSVRNQCESSI